MARQDLNAGLPKSVRAQKGARIRLVCPICKQPGIAVQGLYAHLRIAHDRSSAEDVARLVDQAPSDPMTWLDALETITERLRWVETELARVERYPAAGDSLRLAAEILERQRHDLLEMGHAAAFEKHKGQRGKRGRPRKTSAERSGAAARH